MTFNNSAIVGLVVLVELKVLEHFPASILKTTGSNYYSPEFSTVSIENCK